MRLNRAKLIGIATAMAPVLSTAVISAPTEPRTRSPREPDHRNGLSLPHRSALGRRRLFQARQMASRSLREGRDSSIARAAPPRPSPAISDERKLESNGSCRSASVATITQGAKYENRCGSFCRNALCRRRKAHLWHLGDSLNGITDAIRRHGKIEWVHVRHEEVAAFAAGAEALPPGGLAVCAESCGPGNLHLINGFFDCPSPAGSRA